MKDSANMRVESKKSGGRSVVVNNPDATIVYIEKIHERAETVTPLLRGILESSRDRFEK